MQNPRELALVKAVEARHADEDPESTVQRAEAFHKFLDPPQQADDNG